MKQARKTLYKEKSKKKETGKELSLKDKIKSVYPLKHGLLDPKGYWRKFKHSLNRPKAILVNMELRSGYHVMFYVYPTGETFTYKKSTYKIEDEFKYFNPELNVYCLDYHQELSIPLQRKINTSQLKRALVGRGVTDIDQAINPRSLEQFIKSEVIQKVMKGQELDSFFRLIKVLLIIIALVCVIHLVAFLQISGALDNMNLPF